MTTAVHHHHFEHDGFRFEVKARPIMALELPEPVTPEARLAFDLAIAAGVESVAQVLGARERVAAWRVAVRAETTRTLEEVAELPWPSETHIDLGTDGEARLVCHAAAEIPAGVDMLEAMAGRLRLEGPIGEQAATAFVIGSIGDETGSVAFWLVGTLAWTAILAGALWASRLGGWWKPLVAIAGALAIGCFAAAAEAWANRRPRPFRGS